MQWNLQAAYYVTVMLLCSCGRMFPFHSKFSHKNDVTDLLYTHSYEFKCLLAQCCCYGNNFMVVDFSVLLNEFFFLHPFHSYTTEKLTRSQNLILQNPI